MMAGDDAIADELFGLAGPLPRPGWVLLDVVRERHFTGEILFATTPEVRVYLDRGRIYVAERTTDPPLGARLVDAGALSAVQLEHGVVRVGGDDHLGRLFERSPSVDRHAVLVTAELMTQECVGWLANQTVPLATAVPYRYHPAGVHRWEGGTPLDLAPGAPLPAPSLGQAPVPMAAPEPLSSPVGACDADDMIRWDEPGWLDVRAAERERAGEWPPRLSSDWIDRLECAGLPAVGDDPLGPVARLARLPVEPADRFEVIWPDGAVDEEFGDPYRDPVPPPHPDHDRGGPTARIAWSAPEPAADAAGVTGPAPALDDPTAEPADEPADEPAGEPADEVVLAVRRAVASIETGVLAARRPATAFEGADTSRGLEPSPALPSRRAVRAANGTRLPAPPEAAATRPSVFDDVAPALAPPPAPADPAGVAGADAPPERASALRRLIASLRRH